MYCYNGRLPVEALAHHSWAPIQKNIIHIQCIVTEKSAEKKQKQTKNVQKWHVHAQNIGA